MYDCMQLWSMIKRRWKKKWYRIKNASRVCEREKMDKYSTFFLRHTLHSLDIFSFMLRCFYAIEPAPRASTYSRAFNGKKWNKMNAYFIFAQHLLFATSIFITSEFVIYANAPAHRSLTTTFPKRLHGTRVSGGAGGGVALMAYWRIMRVRCMCSAIVSILFAYIFFARKCI